MFCPYCGKEIPDGAKFCGMCGQKIRPTLAQLQNTQQNSIQPWNARQVSPQPGGSNNNSKKKLIIPGVIAGVLVLAAVLVVVPFAVPLKADSYQEQIDLGEQYLAAEDYEQAIVAYTAAIEIDDQQTDAYMVRAEAYIALALEEAEGEAAESDDTDGGTEGDAAAETGADAESTEGEGTEESGASAGEGSAEESAAQDVGTDAEGTEDSASDAEGSAADDAAEENLDKALADYRTVIGLEPERILAYIRAANIYTVYRADYESAEAILEEGLTANPDDEDLTEALEEVEKLIEEAQEDAAEEMTAAEILTEYAQQNTYLAGNTYQISCTAYDSFAGICTWDYMNVFPENPLTWYVYDFDQDGQEELLIVDSQFTDSGEEFIYSTAQFTIYEAGADGSVSAADSYTIENAVLPRTSEGFTVWFTYEEDGEACFGFESHAILLHSGDGSDFELVLLQYQDGEIREREEPYNAQGCYLYGDTHTLANGTVLDLEDVVCNKATVYDNALSGTAFCESTAQDYYYYGSSDFSAGDVVFAVSVTDSHTQTDDQADWKTLYRDFLLEADICESTDISGDTEYQFESGELEGTTWRGFGLIYVNDDEIPELVLEGVGMAQGDVILTVTEDRALDYIIADRCAFEYVERGNCLNNSSGNSGAFFDYLYSIGTDGWVEEAVGTYQYTDEEQYYTDDPQYVYQWNGEDVSAEAYAQHLAEYYDASEAVSVSEMDMLTLQELFVMLSAAE